ncbi:type II toxin-antitoxin system PemK/MazF family toxin [Clostridium tagluense]|uniref:type II toxin-antitoxin system PemK/MazF family toxin n=1 Tax=Clostridium tagluense TaxID=360422 RepID=UPI001CF3ADAA|nr:type II toxin-antitoxin system PemK/MazF family toxin [Clostridium tagluense]MCB2300628.1 type II toxin-antitoxin system PemK/MazF family toxin [Clostridium tagluense]MCB2311641.1 type II toxin-antitoxin system PemK/MazF family toxin [Clostridium tagluense]MCB2316365.1 type II toxin-antitoxin system PemK/MazF family toxin [Clostridium tagluense]MCB2321251.1 type II toxin-antitoxin system PemK/MazF family toxin [Clostridium tagluense]MCB2326234.1 type II toxin-antitoxin system PemK/MazF fami
MGKTGYYRWEIWKADLSEFGIENHFCIIISNFKNNTKNANVQICLITSKLKEFTNRVNINLLTESQIKCDTILTLSKSKLLYKQCKIEDVIVQLEVEKNLENQLQLSEKYINTDVEQLMGYLGKGVQKVDNESNLVNLRNSICNLAVQNKHQEAVILCNESIQIASTSNLENKNDFLWHSTYHRSLMFSKLGNIEIALEDSRESLKYVGSLRNGLNNRYSYSMWRISNCDESIGDIVGAIRILFNLNIYYKKVGKVSMRIEILFNIARLKNNLPKMKYLMSLVEKMEFNERDTNKTKEVLLEDMRKDLIKMQ